MVAAHHHFGMPLDAQDAGAVDGFDDVVGGDGGDLEAQGHVGGTLVVVAVDSAAGDVLFERALHDDAVAAGVGGAQLVGHVLVQGAAKGDGDHLVAATDTEDGDLGGHCPADERPFDFIAVGVTVGVGATRLAVEPGVNVGPTQEEEAFHRDAIGVVQAGDEGEVGTQVIADGDGLGRG